MPKFKFSKLVRDKIVDHQVASGAKPTYRHLSEEEHKQALVTKIIEEVQEIATARTEDLASEIADVQQALDDLKKKYRLSNTVISDAQQAKKTKNGAFEKGIYVDYLELEHDHEWFDYYIKNADRYPEIN